MSIDAEALRASWSSVLAHGDEVPLFFYSHLALSRPDIRELFPVVMAGQRDKFVVALGRIVSSADRTDELVPYLQRLGATHVQFGTTSEHYAPVGQSLIATLAYFLGELWTNELAQQWQAAYELVASVMQDAAAEVEQISGELPTAEESSSARSEQS
ncbi:globin domain-containing protein [Lentzea tibetensis]|uniref:globin domain-containing protein n=1 Tax=Lentzea tibetensis TaxID=2591470 RepID=UPI001C98E9C8|nr:globin domain-containing protein [Lentzea tibetensis]